MEDKNNLLGDIDDSVSILLDRFKSNGMFDKLRRHFITEVYSKPSFHDWKQKIEYKAKTFLSGMEYTPELNKNTVRDELRTHIFDGSMSQDIEGEADLIIDQILGFSGLKFFESQIDDACNEFLGIGNEESPTVHYGLKDSSMDLINLSNIEGISTVMNPKIDINLDIDMLSMICDKTQEADGKDSKSDKNEKSSSLCIEPEPSNDNQSDHTYEEGESSKCKKSIHKHITSTSNETKSSFSNHKSSREDKSCKDVLHKSKVDDKYKDIAHKSGDTVEKSKEVVSKPKYVSDKYNDVNKPKSIVHKLQDVGKSKGIENRPKDVVDRPEDESFLSKNSNSSSDKHNEKDKKRIKHSHEERKKSTSLCKELKIFNVNHSDDESDAGRSTEQKITVDKNKNLTEKSKPSSSNHRICIEGNGNTDFVVKSKDKLLSRNPSVTDIHKSKDKSMSANFSNTDVAKAQDKSLFIKNKPYYKSNQTDTKRYKLSQIEIKNQLTTKNLSVEEKKPSNSELNDFQSSIMTDYEKDRENVNFIDNSSPTTETLKIQTTQNELEVNEYSTQAKILPSNDKMLEEERKPTISEWNEFQNSIMTDYEKDVNSKILPSIDKSDDKKNFQSESSKLKTSKSLNSLKSAHKNIVPKISPNKIKKVVRKCYVVLERLPCESIKMDCSSINNLEVTKEHQKPAETVVNEKELKTSNDEMNMDPCSSNTDKSLNTFKGFSENETVRCKSYNLLKNLIKQLESEENNHNVIDDGLQGSSCGDTLLTCAHHSKLFKFKKNSTSLNNFIGFSMEESQMSIGHTIAKQQLQQAKNQNSVKYKQQKNMKSGGDGIQDNQLNEKNKKDNLTVNNDDDQNWIREQCKKFNILPSKVVLERYNINLPSTNIITSKK